MSAPPSASAEPDIAVDRAHLAKAGKIRRKRHLLEFVQRLARRRSPPSPPPSPRSGEPPPRARRLKRKTALIASAAIMGLNTAASGDFDTAPIEVVEPKQTRQHVAKLSASDELLATLAEEEGVHLTVYRDPIGLPTVGVGHLVKASDGLSVGDRIDMDQAMRFLERDIRQAESAVARLVGDLPLYQHEFDALVDLVFNVGEGGVSDAKSPRLNEAIARGSYLDIAEELDYFNAAGAQLNGLIYRSRRRAAIFVLGDYEDPRPAHRALASVKLT